MRGIEGVGKVDALATKRRDRTKIAIAAIKAEIGAGEVEQERLDRALLILLDYADPAFFPLEHFPAEKDGGEATYRLWEEQDHSFAMYLSVSPDGVRTPPHNHLTWAVNTALIGEEINVLYQVSYQPSEPGESPVKVVGSKTLRSGVGIGLMPRDIHAIETKADEADGIVMSLHLYGHAIDQPSERQMFDLISGQAEGYPSWDGIIDPPMGA